NRLMKQTIPSRKQIYPFELTIVVDTNVEANETFFVNVTNVNGATVQKGTGTVTIPNDDIPPVVISEFRTRGPNGANDEFIEIYNSSDSLIEISDWKLKASNSVGTIATRVTINNNTLLLAYGLFLD